MTALVDRSVLRSERKSDISFFAPYGRSRLSYSSISLSGDCAIVVVCLLL